MLIAIAWHRLARMADNGLLQMAQRQALDGVGLCTYLDRTYLSVPPEALDLCSCWRSPRLLAGMTAPGREASQCVGDSDARLIR